MNEWNEMKLKCNFCTDKMYKSDSHHWFGWLSMNRPTSTRIPPNRWPRRTLEYHLAARWWFDCARLLNFHSNNGEAVWLRWKANKIMELFQNYFSMTKATASVVDVTLAMSLGMWLMTFTCESEFGPPCVGTMRIMCRIPSAVYSEDEIQIDKHLKYSSRERIYCVSSQNNTVSVVFEGNSLCKTNHMAKWNL